LGILIIGPCLQYCRSSAPSPVPTISTSQTAPASITPIPSRQLSPASSHVANFMSRSVERQNLLQQPMTRSEYIQRFGRKSYNNCKWKWNGAARGERR